MDSSTFERSHYKFTSDEGLHIHDPDTCDIHDASRCPSSKSPFNPRTTAIETRLVPSHKGFVAICYETKGLITFYAQISPTRLAWQRIAWPVDFHKDWNNGRVQEAVDNFLNIAEKQETQP